MKIALIGSAPSSIRLAPYGDPSWQIWACSPGAYPVLGRCDLFYELHRWEPPVIGKADQQKAWFSPEYVMWMAQQRRVYMIEPVPQIPNSRALPARELVSKYGTYFFTSTLAWMFAMAIEAILEERQARKEACANSNEPDQIGLWGVDMGAVGEYGYQRAGCQFFAQIAEQLGIQIIVPPESDLLVPPPLYGIVENDHQMIKLTERYRELSGKLAAEEEQLRARTHNVAFLKGAIDDLDYMLKTWVQLDKGGANLRDILNGEPLFKPPLPPEENVVTFQPEGGTESRVHSQKGVSPS